MMKNRFLAAFALSGLVAFAACESGAEDTETVDIEATEEVAPPVDVAPVTPDTLAPATTDTGALVPPADTAAL